MNRDDATTRRVDSPNGIDPSVERLAEAAIECAFRVHRELGPGCLESIYESAMEIELTEAGIPHLRQPTVSVAYKGRVIGDNRLDFLIGDALVIELKAIDRLASIHIAQVLSYLRSMRLPLGILINFNVPLLKDGIRRIITSDSSRRRVVAVQSEAP